MGLTEHVEWFAQLVVGDLVAVDVELGEEGLVEDGAHGLAASLVEGAGVIEEGECVVEDVASGVEVLLGVVEFAADLRAFLSDGGDLVAECVFGPAFFGGEVEQVGFFGVEFGEAGGVAFAQVGGQLVGVGDGGVDDGADFGAEVLGEPYRVSVVGFDGLFHDFDGYVGLVAGLVFAAAAEEVVIDAVVAALGALDDEALAASGAPDGAFEIVVVGALAGAGAGVAVEDALYAIEEVFGDEGVVADGVFDAFVGDVAEVVAGAE